jgi:MurNAc alpha-1-phosphate uridylyltransferase
MPVDAAEGGEVAGVVLAAGAGTRLRPLTLVRPKPMCPVGDRPLVDHAIERVGATGAAVAVNVHHGRAMLEAHLAGRVHVSIEEREALGTAGALGQLRDWIAGRPVLVVNGDTWTDAPLASLLDGWDGERSRLLVVGRGVDDVDRRRPRLVGALLPWSAVAELTAEPSGLWERRWAAADAEGRLDWAVVGAAFADCGTPAAYLAANLAVSGGAPVIGAGAEVRGTVERSVIWPGLTVGPDEHLVEAIRYAEARTVLVRP